MAYLAALHYKSACLNRPTHRNAPLAQLATQLGNAVSFCSMARSALCTALASACAAASSPSRRAVSPAPSASRDSSTSAQPGKLRFVSKVSYSRRSLNAELQEEKLPGGDKRTDSLQHGGPDATTSPPLGSLSA